MLPTITVSLEEQDAGLFNPDTLSEAIRTFNANGTLVVKHAFAPELIKTMHAAFMERYQQYLLDKEYEDALRVGNKRFMVTVALDAPFNTPLLYANPFIHPLLMGLLTPEYILGSFGAVVSLPGAEAQHVHRDFPGLFPGTPLNEMLPSFAITMIVPLVEANEVTGSTLVWPKTHRSHISKAQEAEPELPILALGDCLLMDYILVHGGAANRSDQVRPILYNLYCRPWFQDSTNFSKQERLQISPEALDQVPAEHRHLFAR